MITLGTNKPILHVVSVSWILDYLRHPIIFEYFQDLDVKSLLLEAFYKGQQELLYVVPFIAKMLESCQKSKVSYQTFGFGL